MVSSERSFWRDAVLVGLYSLILFGFAGISGRPLTMHEARLPETSREMLARHDWLLPTSGGRPWLERPPLPHWIVISAMKLFGYDDRVWIVRLPSAVMGTITVLLTMYIARKWFDPNIGVVAACLLATSLKFYQYATLAEDDVYLAAIVALAAALFTHAELSPPIDQRLGLLSFFTNRSWAVWGFFTVLGLSNLAKGPLLGIVILGTPVAVYACLVGTIEKNWQSFFRYTWFIGWGLLIGLTLVWPVWAWHRYPDVLDNFKYDYLGRISGAYAAIDQPWWYYPPYLFVGLLPWAPLSLLGMCIAWSRGFRRRALRYTEEPDALPINPALRSTSETGVKDRHASVWVLCWAFVPLLVLSIPKGKHDHYLVPFLAPWAILGALGLVYVGKWFHQPGRVLAGLLLIIGVAFCVGEARFAARTDHTVDDTAFLIRCKSEVPADIPLYIDSKLGPPGNLDFFRIQFYSRSDAILLHNLSFLRAVSIPNPIVYVIARQGDERLLAQMGSFQRIDQSKKSHEGDKSARLFGPPVGNFTLYRLSFFPALQRYPDPGKISSLQAMERAPGPWCGPPLQ